MKLSQLFSFLLILGISMNVFAEPHFIDDGVMPAERKVSDKKAEGTVPWDKKDYEVLECYSNGTCLYLNKVTGEKKIFKTEAIIQAGATEKKEAPKDAKEILTKEELAFWERKETTSLADFKKMVAISNKLGKKYLVIQVGNLGGCPPCQALDRNIKAAELGKKQNADIVDFNYFNNRGNDFAQYLHNNLTLPQGFSFPYVYVFQLKDGWIDYYKMIPNNEASVSKIESSMKELQGTAAKSKK